MTNEEKLEAWYELLRLKKERDKGISHHLCLIASYIPNYEYKQYVRETIDTYLFPCATYRGYLVDKFLEANGDAPKDAAMNNIKHLQFINYCRERFIRFQIEQLTKEIANAKTANTVG